MLTKKDNDVLDDVQAGRKNIDDTHLAEAAAEREEDRQYEAKAGEARDIAAEDDGKLHVARDFGEAIADLILPGAGTHNAATTGAHDIPHGGTADDKK